MPLAERAGGIFVLSAGGCAYLFLIVGSNDGGKRCGENGFGIAIPVVKWLSVCGCWWPV